MAKYTYQFIIKKDGSKVFDIKMEDHCILVNQNDLTEKTTEDALAGVRFVPGDSKLTDGEANEYGGLRKHFASIIREFGQYGTHIKEQTKNVFNNILKSRQ